MKEIIEFDESFNSVCITTWKLKGTQESLKFKKTYLSIFFDTGHIQARNILSHKIAYNEHHQAVDSRESSKESELRNFPHFELLRERIFPLFAVLISVNGQIFTKRFLLLIILRHLFVWFCALTFDIVARWCCEGLHLFHDHDLHFQLDEKPRWSLINLTKEFPLKICEVFAVLVELRNKKRKLHFPNVKWKIKRFPRWKASRCEKP